MEKMQLIFLTIFLALITGCGAKPEQKLVCKTTETEEGVSIEQVISMTYENDKLKHMTMYVNTTITDATIKENWEQYKKVMDEDNKEFTGDGVSLKIVVDDQNYKYNTILDIDVLNANDEVLKEYGFDGIKEDKSTLKSSKESAESDGAICEIE